MIFDNKKHCYYKETNDQCCVFYNHIYFNITNYLLEIAYVYIFNRKYITVFREYFANCLDSCRWIIFPPRECALMNSNNL